MIFYAIVKARIKNNKNPQMSINQKPHTTSRHFLRRGGGALGLSLLIFGFSVIPNATASNYQAQINSLNSQNTQDQSALNGLSVQATNYQQAINAYQAQINDIENSINANQVKLNEYQLQIQQDQTKIAVNKNYLSTDLKEMYVQGQMSTIEQLATSQNLSSFMNKQEDNIKIQDQLDGLLTTIKQLQLQAQTNKDQVVSILATEKSQQVLIAADQQQQNQLLSMNQQQQSNYNSQIAANNSQIANLRAEQAAANASISRTVNIRPSSGSGGACDIGYGNGGYPTQLCAAPQDSLVDPYGFPNRECTSFANWYFINVEGQANFQVNGNAGWWWETSNYPVSTYPNVVPGAIGVEPSSSLNAPVPSLHGGYYGHVMIVLALPGTTYDGHFPNTNQATGVYVPQGYVLVASMNEDFYGHYMYNLWPANYLMYINPQ